MMPASSHANSPHVCNDPVSTESFWKNCSSTKTTALSCPRVNAERETAVLVQLRLPIACNCLPWRQPDHPGKIGSLRIKGLYTVLGLGSSWMSVNHCRKTGTRWRVGKVSFPSDTVHCSLPWLRSRRWFMRGIWTRTWWALWTLPEAGWPEVMAHVMCASNEGYQPFHAVQ